MVDMHALMAWILVISAQNTISAGLLRMNFA